MRFICFGFCSLAEGLNRWKARLAESRIWTTIRARHGMEEDAHMTSEEEGLTDDEIQEALDGASSLDMSEAGQDSRKKRKKKV